MVYKINKDLKLRKIYIKIFAFKQLLKSFIKNPSISLEERQFLHFKILNKYKYRYSIARLRNHCILTQNTHSIYKCVKLSRHSFKKKVLNGQLPG
jgi:ribosomal protein S14